MRCRQLCSRLEVLRVFAMQLNFGKFVRRVCGRAAGVFVGRARLGQAWAAGVAGMIVSAVAVNGAGGQEKGAEEKRGKGEVRGTWVTTTANDAIASPQKTAETMRRLREIGINTVYVECWKNGYTQFPSSVLERTIGLDRRPALMKSDPSDSAEQAKAAGRDLVAETLAEARKNDLTYIAWFEYGFMAAFKDSQTHLRRMKPEWLSRDRAGGEVAPNGFVWMNPLHPQARRFLLDIVLEAIDRYDLDGVQLDDRIVWPYITMGYDDYTREVYAAEHDGKQPPDNEKDAGWMRWRADKVNEFSKMFVQEIRAKRPGLIISLSPAPYPWVFDNYLLEWPKWSAWTPADGLNEPRGMAVQEGAGPAAGRVWSGAGVTPRWDEFIPQCYRFSYEAFERTWLEQVGEMKSKGGGRVSDLIAGIRVVGEGADSTWEDLRKSMEVVRATGGGGHVHWFSRGVLDVYPKELTEFYNVKELGFVAHPKARRGVKGAGVDGARGSGLAEAASVGAASGTTPAGRGTGLGGNLVGEGSNVAEAVRLMEGHFSSRQQSLSDESYFDIRLHMKRIWPERSDGAWLYVEQAMEGSQEKPYRQRVYRVGLAGDGRVQSDVYTLPGEASAFAGGWKDVTRFEKISPGDLAARVGCAVYLASTGEGSYEGSTDGSKCGSELRGAKYATSEVQMNAEGLQTWDRGFDGEGKQVWGATEGPYLFRRVGMEEATMTGKAPVQGVSGAAAGREGAAGGAGGSSTPGLGVPAAPK